MSATPESSLSLANASATSLSSREDIESRNLIQLSEGQRQLLTTSWAMAIYDNLPLDGAEFEWLSTAITPCISSQSSFCSTVFDNVLHLQLHGEYTFSPTRDETLSFCHIVHECINTLEFNTTLQTVCANHANAYNTNTESLQLMSEAVLTTLNDILKANFTSELEDCWIHLIVYIVNTFPAFNNDNSALFTVEAMKYNTRQTHSSNSGSNTQLSYLEFPIPRILKEDEDGEDNKSLHFDFMPKSSTTKDNPQQRRFSNDYTTITRATGVTSHKGSGYAADKNLTHNPAASEPVAKHGTIPTIPKNIDCIIM